MGGSYLVNSSGMGNPHELHGSEGLGARCPSDMEKSEGEALHTGPLMRGTDVHAEGAAFHRLGPSSVGRKVCLDEVHAIDRRNLGDGDFGPRWG